MNRTRPFGYLVLTALATFVLVAPVAIARYVRESVHHAVRGHRHAASR